MTMRPGCYVAIAGPIGVGKSVVGEILKERLGGKLLREAYQDNPFLERLYTPGGIARWGLACEMSFLPERFDQAMKIGDYVREGKPVVTDWFLGQNLIYSRLTLSDEEYKVYEDVYDRLMRATKMPDCLVCLHADLSSIRERIQRRGREMERTIDVEYLEQLTRAYMAWEERPPVRCPVLHIDTTDLPIPTSLAAQSVVLERVWGALRSQGFTEETTG